MVFRFEGATLYQVVEDAAFESSANAVASFLCVSMVLDFTCIMRFFDARYLGRVSYMQFFCDECKNSHEGILVLLPQFKKLDYVLLSKASLYICTKG